MKPDKRSIHKKIHAINRILIKLLFKFNCSIFKHTNPSTYKTQYPCVDIESARPYFAVDNFKCTAAKEAYYGNYSK